VAGRSGSEPFYFFLDMQLSPLEISQYDIIDRRVGHGFRDFSLERAMFPHELLKMRFNRHVSFSLW
jgi:hypothetical protein